MPILIYTPDGGEPERHEFAFGDIAFAEVVELERLTKRNWGDIETAYWADSFEVQGYLLLVLMRRTEPGLTMEQLNLRPRQVAFDVTAEERDRFVASLLRQPDLTEEQREALKVLEVDPDAETPAEVAEDPKA